MPICYLSPVQMLRPEGYGRKADVRRLIWLGMIGAVLEAAAANECFSLESGRVVSKPFRIQAAVLPSFGFIERLGGNVCVKALIGDPRNGLERVMADEPDVRTGEAVAHGFLSRDDDGDWELSAPDPWLRAPGSSAVRHRLEVAINEVSGFIRLDVPKAQVRPLVLGPDGEPLSAEERRQHRRAAKAAKEKERQRKRRMAA